MLSKQQILDHVWQYDFNGEDNVVETYVSYLRRKLDDAEPRLLRTVRGFGYVLRADDARLTRRCAVPHAAWSLSLGAGAGGRPALVVAACWSCGLTRASLVDRIDRELLAVAGGATRLQRLAGPQRRGHRGRPAAGRDASRPAGQRDPRRSPPASPATRTRCPRSRSTPPASRTPRIGQIEQRPSVDGTMDYRVLIGQGDRTNLIVAVAAPMTSVTEAPSAP